MHYTHNKWKQRKYIQHMFLKRSAEIWVVFAYQLIACTIVNKILTNRYVTRSNLTMEPLYLKLRTKERKVV